MRVLIVSYYFPPYMNVGGFRPMSWARRLYDRGHDVTVIRGDGQEADSCAYFSENLDRPVKVINVHNPMLREPVPEKPGEPNKPSPSPTIMDKLKETIKPWLPMVDSYFIWARQAIAAARDEIEGSGGFDAVISTSFPLSAHEVARAVKKKFNCRWIADFRDFYGQFDSNAVDRDSPRGRFLARRFASYGKEIDLAITVSGKLKPLVDKALDIDTTTILYNGYFEEHLPKRVDVEPEWRILYTGSYNETEFTVSPLVEALRSWPERGRARPGVVFTGSPAPSVVRAFESIGMRVDFLGSVDNRRVLEMQGRSQFLLLCDAMSGPGTLLTKTFEYLAARRPIIAISRQGSDLRSGLFSDPAQGYCLSTEPAEISRFIRYWESRNPDDEDTAFYPREKVKQYSRERQADRLVDYLESADNSDVARIEKDRQ
jgi:glycosyltransferase involved in cell wall biosynthesis